MKEILKRKVLEDTVLLHGSPKRLTEIKPFYTDNELAICATQHPELAIFMAVLGACKIGTFGFNVFEKNGNCKASLTLCKEKLQHLIENDAIGYVYSLDPGLFVQCKSFEYRAYESVYAQEMFIVTKEHLPFFPTPGQLHYDIHLDHRVAHAIN